MSTAAQLFTDGYPVAPTASPRAAHRTLSPARCCAPSAARPLAFFEDGPRATNVTPDKLPTAWRDRFVGDSSPCHSYFSHILDTFRPEVVFVMGDWVERTVRRWSGEARLVRLPHPSPANPVANRGWAAAAQRILREAGLPWRS